MNGWSLQRSSAISPQCDRALEELGVNGPEFDNGVLPQVDQVLCGIADERLDAEYPPLFGELRLILTDPFRGLPALRIAFVVEGELGSERKVVYVGADLRDF